MTREDTKIHNPAPRWFLMLVRLVVLCGYESEVMGRKKGRNTVLPINLLEFVHLSAKLLCYPLHFTMESKSIVYPVPIPKWPSS